jgi:DNA invertase Pin-like site-specific DNA recombinase
MKLAGFIPHGQDVKKQRGQLRALAGDRPLEFYVEKNHLTAFVEDREELQDALEACRTEGSTFALASVSGFTNRRWSGLRLLSQFADEGIEIEVADDPTISSGSIAVLALSAEVARDKILTRSAEALERIKSRLKDGETHVSKSGREIRKLGARSQAELSKIGNDAKVDAANQFAEDMRPFIEPLVARGMNMSAIASHLNRLGIKTSKGGRFYQSTVSGILRRLRNADKH